MTENEFELFIKQAITEHFDEYIPESEIDRTPHKFSKEFEDKMNKLMGKPMITKRLTFKRVLTYIMVAIITAVVVTFGVAAIREAFTKFITYIFDTHTGVISITDETAPLDFTDVYEISSDLSDFDLVDFSENEFNREYLYENEHITMYFRQYIKEYYDISENTEGYDMELININGMEGYYIDMYGINAEKITWDNGDYIISIFVFYDDMYKIGKSEMIEYAKSVKKTV